MATEPLPALPTQSSRRFGAGIINRWVADLRGAAPYLTAAVWLTLCLHGPLIVTAQFRYSFDAGVHEFFADHYRRSWFDLWEPRWYGGFSVASYPPLTHQLLALLSWPLGHEAAFGALLLAVLLAYPPAVYRFSRLFVGERASRYAAVATPLVPSLGLTAHSFGQLPTLVSSLGVLLLVPALADYLESGRRRSLGLAVALAGAATAAHHATFLFWLPLMCLAVTGRVLLLAGGPPVSPIHGTLSLRRRRGLAAMPSRSEPPPDSGGPHSVMLSRSEASPRLALPATGRCFAAAQHDGGWAPRGLCRLALAAAQPDGGWAPRG
ncbi:MAG: hypothetical protein HY331_12125, partial [Chloroflexi bacterium]|nr:hypothetical protein [Chloroflexota bacterium]